MDEVGRGGRVGWVEREGAASRATGSGAAEVLQRNVDNGGLESLVW